MQYQLVVSNHTLLQGDVIVALMWIVVLVFILTCIVVLILHKLRETDAIKNEFITIVAHKFRTPLTRVKWIIDETIREEQDIAKREDFKDMKKANEELIILTGTMTQLAARDGGKVKYTMEPVVLGDFVREAAEPLKILFSQKNISFAVACANPYTQVRVDKNTMSFVLQTMMGNACLYTPPGKRVDVNVSEHKNKAIVTVLDYGIGIEPKDISRIFTKFYRAQNAQEVSSDGFGVSLYMSRAIVKRHHGNLEAVSEGVNKGSTFTLTLPIYKVK